MPITQAIYLFISSVESQTQYRTSPSTFTCICRGMPASHQEGIGLKASQRKQRHSFSFRTWGSLLEEATNKQEKKMDSGVHTFVGRHQAGSAHAFIHSLAKHAIFYVRTTSPHCLYFLTHTLMHNNKSRSPLPAHSFHTCKLFNFAQRES